MASINPTNSLEPINVYPLIIPGWARPSVVEPASLTPLPATPTETNAAAVFSSVSGRVNEVALPIIPLDPRDAQTLYNEGVAACEERLKISRRKDDEAHPNFVNAFYCFTNAAIKGHAQAMFSLGVLCEYARGTKRDTAKALAWYIQSAAHGNIDVMNHIGSCYHLGIGTPNNQINVVEAYTWYRRLKWHSPNNSNGAPRELPKIPEDDQENNPHVRVTLSYLEMTYDFPFVLGNWGKLLALFDRLPATRKIWIYDRELHDRMKVDLFIKPSNLSGPLKHIRDNVILYIRENVSAINIDKIQDHQFSIYSLLKLLNNISQSAQK